MVGTCTVVGHSRVSDRMSNSIVVALARGDRWPRSHLDQPWNAKNRCRQSPPDSTNEPNESTWPEPDFTVELGLEPSANQLLRRRLNAHGLLAFASPGTGGRKTNTSAKMHGEQHNREQDRDKLTATDANHR